MTNGNGKRTITYTTPWDAIIGTAGSCWYRLMDHAQLGRWPIRWLTAFWLFGKACE